MSSEVRLRRSVAVVAGATAALGALAPAALAQTTFGVSLNRTPSPPQAIARGTGSEQIGFTITYASLANRWDFFVNDQQGVRVYSQSTSIVGQPSPISGQTSWTPPAAAAPGRYEANIQYFSSSGRESTASVTFDVAEALGALTVAKYEDLNGNGRPDTGEPRIPNWQFLLKNPQGNDSVVTTGADGSVSNSNVPSGTWQVNEPAVPGWVPTTTLPAAVSVPANGSASAEVGNVRPAPLSGTVYLDVNSNAVLDSGEAGKAGVTLTLTGTTGTGRSVTATTVSGANGFYEFPGLMPGSYTVVETVPSGFTATTPTTRADRVIVSGVGNPNNDFGLKETTGTVAQTPDVTISKTAVETVKRGGTFTYRVTVKNTSPFVARAVQVTDLVPANLTLVAIPAGATIRNGVVTWVVGDMAAGATKNLSMQVRVNPTSTVKSVTNTATVTATGLGPRSAKATTKITDTKPVVRRTGAVTG